MRLHLVPPPSSTALTPPQTREAALRAALDRDGYVLLGTFERNRVQLGRRDHAPFGPADVATACGAVGAVMDAGLRRR